MVDALGGGGGGGGYWWRILSRRWVIRCVPLCGGGCRGEHSTKSSRRVCVSSSFRHRWVLRRRCVVVVPGDRCRHFGGAMMCGGGGCR